MNTLSEKGEGEGKGRGKVEGESEGRRTLLGGSYMTSIIHGDA